MIVRLKAKAMDEFQFYDSPIKSRQQIRCKISLELFQFYDSPIKSIITQRNCGLFAQFQFYDSPIKSTPRRWC